MERKIRVLYVSSELAPYAKSGELADVAGALPKYLSAQGIDVSLIIPRYRWPAMNSLGMETFIPEILVPVGAEKVKAAILRSRLDNFTVYFIDNPKYFLREKIYGSSQGDYLDNDERFIFFSRAVLEFLLKAKISVDIIHCNNWPTAMIPVFLKTHYAQNSQFKDLATVISLHNVAYQGEFPPETLALTGLNWDYFTPENLSFNGKFNFLKAGVLFSDAIHTVSSSYRRDIQKKKYGFGLDGILKSRRRSFWSIRNGVDYETWNPERDPLIAASYSPSRQEGKKECKQDLIKEFALSLDLETPLLGIFSYFSRFKGFDLLIEAIDEIARMEMGLAIAGAGDEQYEKLVADLPKKYPGKVGVKLGMTPALAHKITAGADMFLIPSFYEPCGLNQFYSFRYGTVPVVRATGGLKETVRPFDALTLKGNGFVFKDYTVRDLTEAVQKALECYRDPILWQKILEAGFQEKFAWESAAQKYIKLYQRALEAKRGGSIGKSDDRRDRFQF
jgi:starch synthase